MSGTWSILNSQLTCSTAIHYGHKNRYICREKDIDPVDTVIDKILT
jgi:hypothetical protein